MPNYNKQRRLVRDLILNNAIQLVIALFLCVLFLFELYDIPSRGLFLIPIIFAGFAGWDLFLLFGGDKD